MSETSLFTLSITKSEETGLYFVTSNEIRGFLVAKNTIKEALEASIVGLQSLFEATETHPGAKKIDVLETIFANPDEPRLPK